MAEVGPWLLAAGGAALATFLAELGDKSQLLSAGLAARFGRRTVLLGVALGVLVLQAVAVTVGSLVGAALPARTVGLLSGSAFVAVGAWLWWSTPRAPAGADGHEAGPLAGGAAGEGAAGVALRRPPQGIRARAVLVVAGSFAVGELGDKTQLTTVALATQQGPVATFVGAALGVLAANVLAVEVGARLARRLPQHLVLRGSAALFVVVGVVVVGLALAAGGR